MPSSRNKNKIIIQGVSLTLFFCLLPNFVFAQTSLNCGQIVQGAISVKGEKDTYSFTAQANDAITLRVIKTSGSGFYPYLELYAPDGANVAKASGQIDKTLALAGNYTLIVRDDNNAEIGGYILIWYRFNNPGVPSLKAGQIISGAITTTAPFKFYTLFAYANDVVTISINKTSGNFYPYIELYTPNGTKLAEAKDRINLTLTFSGLYTILVRDQYNNFSNTGDYNLSWTKKNTSPSMGSITPSSGLSPINEPVIFTTTYIDSDPAGYHDIQAAHLLINTSTSGANCFWGYYDQDTNKLYLRNDANTSWLGGFAPGSTNIIENSYAKLDCSKTIVSGTGATLTISWSVTFKFAFGNKTYNIYLYAKDSLGAESGWVQKGTWQVDAIEVTSLLPVDKSRYIEGMVINCSAQAAPANPQYQYQFLVDGQIRRPFNASNSWSWQAISQDIGVRTLTVQVKNQYGTKAEGARRLIIYRRPIEPQG